MLDQAENLENWIPSIPFQLLAYSRLQRREYRGHQPILEFDDITNKWNSAGISIAKILSSSVIFTPKNVFVFKALFIWDDLHLKFERRFTLKRALFMSS